MIFDLNKAFLQTQIANVLSRSRDLQWITKRDIQTAKVANFGCSLGSETLALMLALGASEAVGIDKDEDSIHQAQHTLINIQDEIKRVRQRIRYYPTNISEDDKAWWRTVPIFFKEKLIQSAHITFLVADITEPIELPSDYYDVSYCDYVLHHIWYDLRENAEGDTAFAVKEMARVTRPGGTVAARELVQYPGRQKLDFKLLFEKAGLEFLWSKETEFDDLEREGKGIKCKYLYKKSLTGKY